MARTSIYMYIHSTLTVREERRRLKPRELSAERQIRRPLQPLEERSVGKKEGTETTRNLEQKAACNTTLTAYVILSYSTLK